MNEKTWKKMRKWMMDKKTWKKMKKTNQTSALRQVLWMLALPLACLLTLDACSHAEKDDEPDSWLIFRGSPALSGYIDRALPDEPQLQWCFENNVRTVAAPIIYKGTAYTLDRKGVLRGISPDGQLCYERDLQTFVEASFILRDSTIFIGQIDGFVTALSLRTDSVLWQYETEGQISASPTFISPAKSDANGSDRADARLVVGSYDGNMYTLDAQTGQALSFCPTNYYINGAAAIWNDYVLFGGCDAWLRLVNTRTGEQTDSLELRAYVPASPAIYGDCAYISDYTGNIYEVVLADGRIASHRLLVEADRENDEDGGSVAIPAVSPDALYLFSGDRHLVCLDRQTGGERWRKMLRGDSGEASPLVCRDRLLVCTKDGHVSIFATEDSRELWHFEAGEQIIASPAILHDAFYILTSRGKLFRFQ